MSQQPTPTNPVITYYWNQLVRQVKSTPSLARPFSQQPTMQLPISFIDIHSTCHHKYHWIVGIVHHQPCSDDDHVVVDRALGRWLEEGRRTIMNGKDVESNPFHGLVAADMPLLLLLLLLLLELFHSSGGSCTCQTHSFVVASWDGGWSNNGKKQPDSNAHSFFALR